VADDERGDDSADLIEFIAKAIVSQPEEVAVVIEDDGDLIELETADGDRGRVIGRQGRVAKAMRAVLAASNVGPDSRLEIVD
jgi:predicted RNA-binding protein YlqC (UPF0109 family)